MIDASAAPRDEWTWVRVGGLVELDGGRHVLDLRVRERGLAVDRIALSTRGGPPEEPALVQSSRQRR